jgi:mannose/fructose/N-acetylgalactosamine-specific phosphotransferase system component IIC
LNYLAAAGLVLGLTTGALGMNVLAGNKWLDRSGWNELGFTFFLFAMLAMIGWYIADEMTKMRKCRKSKWLAYSLWTTAFLLVTIGFGLLMK